MLSRQLQYTDMWDAMKAGQKKHALARKDTVKLHICIGNTTPERLQSRPAGNKSI